MLFSWFDATKEKEFGATLARFYMERSPLDASDKTPKFVARKQEQVLTKLSQQIDAFKQTGSLNIYKKAQIGNVFKWSLKDAGYDPLYVDELTSWLMLKF